MGPQQGHELTAFDFDCPETFYVIILNLAINRAKLIPFCPFDEMDKSNFRGIALVRVHALSEKHVSDGDSIKSSNELSFTPGFK